MEEKTFLHAIVTETIKTNDRLDKTKLMLNFTFEDGTKIFDICVQNSNEGDDTEEARSHDLLEDIINAIKEAYKIGLAGGTIEFEKKEITLEEDDY